MAAIESISGMIGSTPGSLRRWVRQPECDKGGGGLIEKSRHAGWPFSPARSVVTTTRLLWSVPS